VRGPNLIVVRRLAAATLGPPLSLAEAEIAGYEVAGRVGVAVRSRRRWLLAAAAFVAALALEVDFLGLSLTPDSFFLVPLVPAIVLGRGRRYVVDFGLFSLLLLAYGEARGLAHLLHPHPFFRPQMIIERTIFAGHLPSATLQSWLWSGHLRWYDRTAVALGGIHFIVPPALAFFFWLWRRPLFYRFAATMLTLSFASAVVFFLFPAAPPWAAARAGVIPPLAHLTGTATALPNKVGPIYGLMLGNPYAAIPSLHGGYAFLVFLFVVSVSRGRRWGRAAIVAAFAYLLAQSFAVLYTANHYVVDLAIGFTATWLCTRGVQRLWAARGWLE
jgi:hypothetical protein